MAILDAIGETREQRERQAAHRAGTVAAACYNPHRKKGTRPLTASDIFPALKGEQDVITDPDKGREELLAWAEAVNRQQQEA